MYVRTRTGSVTLSPATIRNITNRCTETANRSSLIEDKATVYIVNYKAPELTWLLSHSVVLFSGSVSTRNRQSSAAMVPSLYD